MHWHFTVQSSISKESISKTTYYDLADFNKTLHDGKPSVP